MLTKAEKFQIKMFAALLLIVACASALAFDLGKWIEADRVHTACVLTGKAELVPGVSIECSVIR